MSETPQHLSRPNRRPWAIAAGILALGLSIYGYMYATKPACCGETPPGPLVAVPSGRTVYYQETVPGEGATGLAYRFRFVAPGLSLDAGSGPDDALTNDLLALCDSFALDRLPATGPKPNQVIISVADRVLPFGQAAPDAVQYFEGFDVSQGRCEWELF